jgi:hypothetical protein
LRFSNIKVEGARPLPEDILRENGTVFDGVTLGAVIAATAVPTSPSFDLCWYWSNSSQTRGYWDFCQ